MQQYDPRRRRNRRGLRRAVDAGLEKAAPDMNNFLTWHPGTFGVLDFSKSPVPENPYTSISSVRSYLAQAMIMWYDPAVRERNAQAWEKLTAAWKATFHTELTAGALEKWPTDGPHGFSEEQCTWLSSTLRHLKGQGRAPARRRVSVPLPAPSPGPAPAAKPAARTLKRASGGGEGSGTARNPDPVKTTRRSAADYFDYYCVY